MSLRYSIYKVQSLKPQALTCLSYHIFSCLSRTIFQNRDLFEPHLEIFPPEPAGCLDLAGIWQGKSPTFRLRLVFALLIFPGSYPPSIVSAHELNFCVRDGNRWTLMAINTNLYRWLITIIMSNACASNCFFGAPSGTRTRDPLIKSQLLYQLS